MKKHIWDKYIITHGQEKRVAREQPSSTINKLYEELGIELEPTEDNKQKWQNHIKEKITEKLQLEHTNEINKHDDLNVYKFANSSIELKSYLNTNKTTKLTQFKALANTLIYHTYET